VPRAFRQSSLFDDRNSSCAKVKKNNVKKKRKKTLADSKKKGYGPTLQNVVNGPSIKTMLT